MIKVKKNKTSNTVVGKSTWVTISAFLSRDILIRKKRMADQVRQDLYFELHVLLHAGVDIRTAFDLIASEQKNKSNQKLLMSLRDTVIAGSSLSLAMQQVGDFSSYEFYSIQIGEESGKLNRVLLELAEFYRAKIKLRRQLLSAMTYPMVILFTAFSAVFFMLNFIVPMFSDIFKRYGSELPWITQLIVNFSSIIRQHSWWMTLLFVGLVLFVYSRRNTKVYQQYSTNLLIRLPIVGGIAHKVYLARFANSMALLIAARIPIISAIQLVKQMIKFYPIEEALVKMEQEILLGKSLHSSMQQFSIFPAKMISLIKVAEEVNQVDVFFSQISNQYTQEVEHLSSIISSLLEPFILIVLGAIVGIILIAMYLPLFQMSKVF